MTEPTNTQPGLNGKQGKPAVAGGLFIALAMIVGIVAGIYMRQISAGMVIGLGIGIAIALLIWLFERRG